MNANNLRNLEEGLREEGFTFGFYSVEEHIAALLARMHCMSDFMHIHSCFMEGNGLLNSNHIACVNEFCG